MSELGTQDLTQTKSIDGDWSDNHSIVKIPPKLPANVPFVPNTPYLKHYIFPKIVSILNRDTLPF